ncbi:hypothetical protein R3P38DRAFT_3204755 [Favolaschia claudopus]|uniref:Uncharacterized protein n=1 Tax=Favolaschia claudopus TaxID=2862362 RepID=A0AAW0ARG7_9AGAR
MPDQASTSTSVAPPILSTAASDACAPGSLPAAVKRLYEEIVQGITPGIKEAKKRKRTQYGSMSAVDKHISTSKHFPRGVNSCLEIVMTYGAESQWGPPPDPNSPALTKEENRLVAAFDKLFLVAPELLPAITQFYLEIPEKPDE